jgi:hypothetical protein
MPSITRRRSTRLSHASIPSPEPARNLEQDNHTSSGLEDVSRVEDSQMVSAALKDHTQEIEDLGTLNGENVTRADSVSSHQKRIGRGDSGRMVFEAKPSNDRSESQESNGDSNVGSLMQIGRNFGDEVASALENGDNFETAPEALCDLDDTITVSFADETESVRTELASDVRTAESQNSRDEAIEERGSFIAPAMGRSIIGGLRKILRDIQRVVLGREEATEIHRLLGDIRNQVDGATTTSQRV